MKVRRLIVLLVMVYCACFFSCRRYASVYNLRKSPLTAADSVAWYDSTFADEKYILDTLLNGRFMRGAFNGNILCAYKGHVFYKRSIGFADIFVKDSLRIDNSFQLASVSKPFTATAILQLCEAGKIKLSDSLEKFFPGFPYKGITVKMLLCHRSGLPDYIKFTNKYFREVRPSSISNDSVIKMMYQLKPRAYSRPDKMYDYSNTGFMLLASIVEKVSGQSFAEYLNWHIFYPCNMQHTYVRNMSDGLQPHSVKAFEDGEPVPESYHNGVVGDKGVYSTVGDLLLFDQQMRKGHILSPQWQDSAYARHNPDWVGSHNYGLGWRLRTGYAGENIVYHSGWWKGFRTLFIRDMTRDITVVIADNVRNDGFLFVEDYLWVFDKEKENIFL